MGRGSETTSICARSFMNHEDAPIRAVCDARCVRREETIPPSKPVTPDHDEIGSHPGSGLEDRPPRRERSQIGLFNVDSGVGGGELRQPFASVVREQIWQTIRRHGRGRRKLLRYHDRPEQVNARAEALCDFERGTENSARTGRTVDSSENDRVHEPNHRTKKFDPAARARTARNPTSRTAFRSPRTTRFVPLRRQPPPRSAPREFSKVPPAPNRLTVEHAVAGCDGMT